MAEDKNQEMKDKIVKTLVTMLDYLGLNATFRIEEKGQKLAVKITSEDAGRIIGRKGQTLESLQLLLNRIMFKDSEDCPHILLDIDGYAKGEREPRREFSNESSDSEGSFEGGGEERREREPRQRRERRRYEGGDREGGREGGREGRGNGGGEHRTAEELQQQALDAAKEVKRWGDAVKLPEMNARDRRIIHVTLQDDTEITTESEGEGAYKKVVISLKNS